MEDAFIPDPRLLAWEGWNEVPAEFRPFFKIDRLLGVPTVRYKANNHYARAMIHKAIMWKKCMDDAANPRSQ